MALSLRRSAARALLLLLALVVSAPARAQVGGTPAPPATIWQFMGIPQGIKKLQGATRNRRGNHPNLEPKPPMRAIADPRNLESPDPSIKKAAEVKTAEDLKAQKIKAVKYLASIGCGCYDADGGVTAALAASMQDCTEDVRYETINAVAEAAENGACARCGEGCCCNKEILTTLAKIAYERGDDGCYLEPSERVREAAAQALTICCPNNTSPVIVPAEPPKRVEEREGGESIDPDGSREAAPLPTPPPTPPLPPGPSVGLPHGADDLSQVKISADEALADGAGEVSFEYGVVVHVSPQHQLAHVHFGDSRVVAQAGDELGVYATMGAQRQLVAKLQVVEAFDGSANVTGAAEDMANIQRGDLVLFPRPIQAAQLEDAASAEWTSSVELEQAGLVAASNDQPVAAAPAKVADERRAEHAQRSARPYRAQLAVPVKPASVRPSRVGYVR